MTARETQLAEMVDACHERLSRRFIVDGVTCVPFGGEELFRAAISESECEAMQALIGLVHVAESMARAFLHRLPSPRA